MKSPETTESSTGTAVALALPEEGLSPRVRTPHSTSDPLNVEDQLTSVGPVFEPIVNPSPRLEYPEHVAAVVPPSSHSRLAVLLCARVSVVPPPVAEGAQASTIGDAW